MWQINNMGKSALILLDSPLGVVLLLTLGFFLGQWILI